MSEQLQMDSELTLEKAINKARQRESVKKQLEMLKTNFKAEACNTQADSAQTHRAGATNFKKQQQQGKQASQKTNQERHSQCTRCGDARGHHPQQCPAREAVCNQCKKKGHYATVCKTKKRLEVNVAAVAEDSDEDVAFLGSVSENAGASPWMAEVNLDNQKAVFKIDTGADVTAVPAQFYVQGQFDKLSRATKILYGPGGMPLKVKGKFTATLNKDNNSLCCGGGYVRHSWVE